MEKMQRILCRAAKRAHDLGVQNAIVLRWELTAEGLRLFGSKGNSEMRLLVVWRDVTKSPDPDYLLMGIEGKLVKELT